MHKQKPVKLSKSADCILDGILQGEADRGGVLISHGAGGTMHTALMENTADRLANLGFLTLRWNFGYVSKGSAPSAAGKREIPEMIFSIDYLKERLSGKPILLIGKSFGARVGTYVGQDRSDIVGYVLYGLPIQGASKTAKPRDWTHLSKLSGRVLFVTGKRDKLCPLDQLQLVQKELSVPYDSLIVPGDHSYKPGGEQQALENCVKWIGDLF